MWKEANLQASETARSWWQDLPRVLIFLSSLFHAIDKLPIPTSFTESPAPPADPSSIPPSQPHINHRRCFPHHHHRPHHRHQQQSHPAQRAARHAHEYLSRFDDSRTRGSARQSSAARCCLAGRHLATPHRPSRAGTHPPRRRIRSNRACPCRRRSACASGCRIRPARNQGTRVAWRSWPAYWSGCSADAAAGRPIARIVKLRETGELRRHSLVCRLIRSMKQERRFRGGW